ncbi:hypothetical protein W97_00695 [Coniosporium apollinis CBS 100218]|uniref:Complex 1 LYR protein domain-containing protein n=1 Tax=Coniosporium apollinis (strain CBS 100218) TaxID=1168221 RepID=R7YHV4_CONA1|nr:uncharacterized protein W97_00695 [Coniosporium apollinis CBS 100218]EON61480.1 hypothetical protein W97_00695 [Coniosporium apollinis CBS 100218]
MPRFLVPKRSGEHRAACIALYRALLSQCAAVPISDDKRGALRNIARNKFRANREHHSTRLLKLGFHAGYEALDLLDASASGDTAATTKIDALLSKTPARLTQPPKKPAPKPRKPAPDHLPPEAKTLDVRPRLTVSGIRRIPKLVNAGGVPILRFKKPQPPGLSRLIKDKIKQRQDMFDRINAMQDIWIPLAEAEDTWDTIVKERFGVTDTRSQGLDSEEPGWSDVMRETVEQSFEWYDAQKEKVRKTAIRMQDIIDQETELARQEKAVRDEKRRGEKLARRAEKRRLMASPPEKALEGYTVSTQARH